MEHLTVEAPKTKEPWKMTQSEFIEAQKESSERAGLKLDKGTELTKKFLSYQQEYHKEWVLTALKDGKFVPKRVLKDYPDLVELSTEHLT